MTSSVTHALSPAFKQLARTAERSTATTQKPISKALLNLNMPSINPKPIELMGHVTDEAEAKRRDLLRRLPDLYPKPAPLAPLKKDTISIGSSAQAKDLSPESPLLPDNTTSKPEVPPPTSKTAEVDEAYEQKKQAILAMFHCLNSMYQYRKRLIRSYHY